MRLYKETGDYKCTGTRVGDASNPFELIDERVQVKLPFGSLDPPPGYT